METLFHSVSLTHTNVYVIETNKTKKLKSKMIVYNLLLPVERRRLAETYNIRFDFKY